MCIVYLYTYYISFEGPKRKRMSIPNRPGSGKLLHRNANSPTVWSRSNKGASVQLPILFWRFLIEFIV